MKIKYGFFRLLKRKVLFFHNNKIKSKLCKNKYLVKPYRSGNKTIPLKIIHGH